LPKSSRRVPEEFQIVPVKGKNPKTREENRKQVSSRRPVSPVG